MAAILNDDVNVYSLLESVARPRPVRLKLAPRIILAVLPISSVFLIYAALIVTRSAREVGGGNSLFGNPWAGFIVPSVMIVVSAVVYWMVRRDRALLRDGELAIGDVTHQEFVKGGRGKQSRIRYRFKDARGQLFQGTGTDYSQELRVGMAVPVFYEAATPEKNVSLCAAACELKTD